ncbi:MAG TPA: hypothetical protein VFT22_25540 [Kofleriaceae bacterium]|nr:hypothetical protein [Kofleriaceae bacterium]
MIGVPFDNNDLSCLGSITEVVAQLVAQQDPELVQLATQYPTTEALAAWIRSLPQRDDDGIPGDGPKVDACLPPQRLRIPAENPNCVERAALYQGVAELIDPRPVRQLATLDFDWGRHTFPIEDGAPVVLDPRVTVEDLARAVAPRKPAPIAIDVNDAIEYTAELAQAGAQAVRNGPSRAHLARNAIRSLVDTGTPPTDPTTIDAIGWFFATAEDVARAYGARALTIVRTTARAISDLVDDILARRQRNLSLEIGGTSYAIPSWLSGLGSLVGKIGLDVGAVTLAPKLAALGISGQMLELVEQELNAEGLSLGPLAKPGRSFSSALNSLSSRRAT